MNTFWRASWSLVITGLLSVATHAQEKGAAPRDARQTVQDYLNSLDGVKLGKRLQLLPLESDDVRKIFDECEFVLLRFPRFPVEVVPMEPLRVNNLFGVCAGRVTHISDDNELRNFFLEHFVKSMDTSIGTAGVRAWLQLAKELHQDGFVQFENPSIIPGDLKFEGYLKATDESGQGKLTVVMEFASGKLSKLSFQGDIVPGARRLR